MNTESISRKRFETRKSVITFLIMAGLVAMTTAALGKGKPGGGTDTGTILIDYDGAITGEPTSCEEKLNADSTVLLCNKGSGFEVGPEITSAVGADPDCFPAGVSGHAVQLFLNKDGSAETWFRFHAFDRNGDEVLYTLETYADEWVGPFPPETGQVVPTYMDSYDWVLRAANRRQGKYACVGGGTDYINVTVERLD